MNAKIDSLSADIKAIMASLQALTRAPNNLPPPPNLLSFAVEGEEGKFKSLRGPRPTE